MTLSVITLVIMALFSKLSSNDTQDIDHQHNSIECHSAEYDVFYCYADCRYAEYRYAECHGTVNMTPDHSAL
jgi:hypothetical protein